MLPTKMSGRGFYCNYTRFFTIRVWLLQINIPKVQFGSGLVYFRVYFWLFFLCFGNFVVISWEKLFFSWEKLGTFRCGFQGVMKIFGNFVGITFFFVGKTWEKVVDLKGLQRTRTDYKGQAKKQPKSQTLIIC